MMLTDLADACRTSGLRVVERRGWRTRGNGQMRGVRTIVVHHDVSPAGKNDGALSYIEERRLSQLTLARDGTVYVVAAGLCYHAGVVHEAAQANAWAIGIEAAHTGRSSDPYPQVQYDAYVALCRALAAHYRLPVARVQGHKEVARPTGRKTDPTFDMAAFRADVAATPEPQEDVMNADQQALLQRTANAVDALIGVAERPLEAEARIIARLAALEQVLAAGGSDGPALVAAARQGAEEALAGLTLTVQR